MFEKYFLHNIIIMLLNVQKSFFKFYLIPSYFHLSCELQIQEHNNFSLTFHTDKLMARHSRTPLPTKHLNELPELFSNFFSNKVQTIRDHLENLCQRLTRTHHMPMTTNYLVVHLIVSLRSQKIHYENHTLVCS